VLHNRTSFQVIDAGPWPVTDNARAACLASYRTDAGRPNGRCPTSSHSGHHGYQKPCIPGCFHFISHEELATAVGFVTDTQCLTMGPGKVVAVTRPSGWFRGNHPVRGVGVPASDGLDGQKSTE
jgi:hypothetical protein